MSTEKHRPSPAERGQSPERRQSPDRGQSPAERGMGLGLRTLNRLAGSELLDRTRLRKPLERALYQGTRGGFRTAGAASRTFSAASKLARPARQARARTSELFDISLDDEQQMLRDAVAAFAGEQVRAALLAA